VISSFALSVGAAHFIVDDVFSPARHSLRPLPCVCKLAPKLCILALAYAGKEA